MNSVVVPPSTRFSSLETLSFHFLLTLHEHGAWAVSLQLRQNAWPLLQSTDLSSDSMLELVSLPALREKEEEEGDDDDASNSARNALPHIGPVSETDGISEKLL